MYAAMRAARLRSARSVACGSLPRLTPPQFGNPGLAAQALIRVVKPSYTTKRYTKYHPKIFGKIIKYKIKFNKT